MSFIIVTFLALLISIEASSSHWQLVEAKPLDSYAVRFRRAPPREFSVASGASITIECEAFSVPPPNMHWLKNGKRIIQDGDDENRLEDSYPMPVGMKSSLPRGSGRLRLFIDCIDAKDEAIYTCVAENPFSRNSINTKLNVISPPSSVLGSRKLNEGDLLAVNNLEEAFQLATGSNGAEQARELSAVSQCLNEKNSRQTEPVRIHFWSHSLLEEQKRNGLLFCRSNVRKQPQQASTAIPTTKTTTNNNQQQSQDLSNKLTSISATAAAATAAAMALTSDSELQQDFSIKQQTQQPTVSWMTPDEKLVTPEMKDKFEILDSGDLLIKDLSWDDMGSYVCTVSDEFSSDSISTFVYPASDKPTKSKRALMMNDLDF